MHLTQHDFGKHAYNSIFFIDSLDRTVYLMLFKIYLVYNQEDFDNGDPAGRINKRNNLETFSVNTTSLSTDYLEQIA